MQLLRASRVRGRAPIGRLEMIDILPETEDHYSAIHEINVLAFSRENEARLVENLRKSPLFDVQLSFVAVRKSKAIGHILFSPITIQREK